MQKLRELSLFSGAGGGLLASKYLLGWKTIGYVEWEDYPQRVLAQRIKDGLLDEAPIFGDIRTFISDGYAERYRGVVDVVSGGFPCQPFTVAGKKAGENDPKNMWPSACKVIKIIRPSYAFLENVPGLVSCGYLGKVLQDLSEIGYDARWFSLSTSETGGSITRERLWILASSNKIRRRLYNHKKRVYVKNELRMSKRFPDFKDVKKDWLVANNYIGEQPDRMATAMDEFKAIGNGQDPIVAATAWNILTGQQQETT